MREDDDNSREVEIKIEKKEGLRSELIIILVILMTVIASFVRGIICPLSNYFTTN